METTILIIDDSPETLETLAMQYDINLPRCRVVTATSAEEAWERLESTHFDILSIDIQLGADDGINLCQAVREKFLDVFIIICSMDGSNWTRERASKAGASYFLPKPLSSEDIFAMFERYLQLRAEPEVSDSSLLDDLLRMADE